MFKPIEERLPIKAIISKQIEEAILSKQFLPDEKLPSENELAAQFSASRTSVREAIQNLAAQGLIRVEKGKGIFVNHITSDTVVTPMAKYLRLKLDRNYVLDLVHARQILEPAIAREAALNHREKDIEVLENALIKLEESTGGYEELAQLDMEFHQDLARATRNIVVPMLLKPIHALLPDLKSTVYANVDEAKESAVLWHGKILEEIKNRNGDGAAAKMLEHLKIAERHAEMILKKNK
ncbi:MAG: FadR family transcriptional regulator [Ignavibacteria bacterium]|nr:MAG: FadR family transcriptional regulator [Ignavibacteria bacterium]